MFSRIYYINRKYALYIHLNGSSLSYHHQKLCNLLSNMKTKPKIIGISESRLEINKQPIKISHAEIMSMNILQLNLVKGAHLSTLIKI